MVMKRILLIGCGGIGSWLAHFLAFGRRNSILNTEITVADPDRVEPKNLLYSNFLPEDVGRNKALVLAERYCFRAIPKRISKAEELGTFDMVIVATDEGRSRSMVYRSGKPWIDLRSKGRGYAVFSGMGKNGEAKRMFETIDVKRRADSCQYGWELDGGKVSFGNLIAASVGWQMIMNWRNGRSSNNAMGMI